MRILSLLAILFLTSCIGTDEVDAPIVGSSIAVSFEQISLLVDSSVSIQATYFNQFGVEEEAQLLWISSNNDVATVSETGLITALSGGQANISASFGTAESSTVLVTVVESEKEVAKVTLTSPQGTQIAIGQEIQLEVEVATINGNLIEGLSVNFNILDESIGSINSDGLLTGLSNGTTQIIAEVEGVQSNALNLAVGTTSRSGTFLGANGYDASGSTELFLAENGELLLSLSNNFDTDFALGTYIYLSNSTSGTTTRNEGLEIQEVFSGGSQLFNISEIDSEVLINDYQYVIVLCKPAAITFGLAELN